MPNDVPLRGGGGRNFIPPFMWDQLLESCLLSDSFPSLFGWISKEGSSFWPPPASKVEEQLIEFFKEQIVLGLVASSGEAIYPYSRHPT